MSHGIEWRRSGLIAIALLAIWATRATAAESSGKAMATAAQALLDTLDDGQRARTVLPADDTKRSQWHYVPKSDRKGLAMGEMNDVQREAVRGLLRAALSPTGYAKVAGILELEKVLKELEKDTSGRRESGRYHVTFFGKPAADGRWALSVEGHHLSLNWTIEQGAVTANTPAFFGANPAEIKSQVSAGPKQGTRTLAKEQAVALALVQSLSDEQRAKAVIAEKAPRDIRAGGQPQPPKPEPAGLAAQDMTDAQRKQLVELIEVYTGNFPTDVAARRWAEIRAAGLEKLHFAWAGATKEGDGHYYRIEGPTILVEYCNVQSDAAGHPANHIHSVWRDPRGEFAIRR